MVVGDYDCIGSLEVIESYWRNRKEGYEENGREEVPDLDKLMERNGIDGGSVDGDTVLGAKNLPPKVDIISEREILAWWRFGEI